MSNVVDISTVRSLFRAQMKREIISHGRGWKPDTVDVTLCWSAAYFRIHGHCAPWPTNATDVTVGIRGGNGIIRRGAEMLLGTGEALCLDSQLVVLFDRSIGDQLSAR